MLPTTSKPRCSIESSFNTANTFIIGSTKMMKLQIQWSFPIQTVAFSPGLEQRYPTSSELEDILNVCLLFVSIQTIFQAKSKNIFQIDSNFIFATVSHCSSLFENYICHIFLKTETIRQRKKILRNFLELNNFNILTARTKTVNIRRIFNTCRIPF